MSATINYLTKIRFGDDALDDLADELAQLGVATPLIVTDAGLTAKQRDGAIDESTAQHMIKFCDTGGLRRSNIGCGVVERDWRSGICRRWAWC